MLAYRNTLPESECPPCRLHSPGPHPQVLRITVEGLGSLLGWHDWHVTPILGCRFLSFQHETNQVTQHISNGISRGAEVLPSTVLHTLTRWISHRMFFLWRIMILSKECLAISKSLKSMQMVKDTMKDFNHASKACIQNWKVKKGAQEVQTPNDLPIFW